jgi:hypothetical protein
MTDGPWSTSPDCPWNIDEQMMHALRVLLRNIENEQTLIHPDAQEGYAKTVAGALGSWKNLPQHKESLES